jgi:hypothetical protein
MLLKRLDSLAEVTIRDDSVLGLMELDTYFFYSESCLIGPFQSTKYSKILESRFLQLGRDYDECFNFDLKLKFSGSRRDISSTFECVWLSFKKFAAKQR